MSLLRLSLFGLAAALLAAPVAFAQEPAAEAPAEQAGPRIYLIGNSLTADTLPGRLDGADAGLVQWHIYCGKNLTFIRENPAGHCVQSSTPWPQALAEGDYDYLSVQPHHGTTPAEDAAIIAEFAAQQPDAVVVLHTAWTHLAKFAAAYEANDADGPMRPSPAYFDAVLKKLRTALPGREIRTTNCDELLYALHEDIEAGRGPFQSLDDVGRDAIHMNHGPGRYLMHNAMRRALGQPPSAAGFELEPEVKAYLDEQLAAHGWRPPAE